MEDEPRSRAEESADEESAAAPPGGAAAGGRPPSDEERAARLREQLKALRVLDVAQDMMVSLVTIGYQKLGLTDEARELRDLDDARLAIELLRGMIEAVAAAGGEQLVTPYRDTLAAMQLNFARVAVPAAEEPAPAERPAATQETVPAGEDVGASEPLPEAGDGEAGGSA